MARKQELYTDSLWEEYAEEDIADIVVDVEAPELQPSYSYRVPEALRNTLVVGACVHVPFAGRDVLGYVIERRKMPLSDPLIPKLKDIVSVIQDSVSINAEQLHLVRWMSEEYVCNLLDAIRCAAPVALGSRVVTVARLRDPELRAYDAGDSLPQGHIIETLRVLDGEAEIEALKESANLPNFSSAYTALLKKGLVIETRDVSRPKTFFKTARAYTLGATAGELGKRPSTQQLRILDALAEWQQKNDTPMLGEQLRKTAGVSAAILKNLVDRGAVLMQEVNVRRAPIRASAERTTAPVFSPGQRLATETLRHAIASRTYCPLLLFGVTASGKTEVYLDAIAQTIAQGRNAMALLPEIALTAQVVDLFAGRFGERVAVIHSNLSPGERHDEWRRLQQGEAQIVVGARSAIFAPLENVGLIIVDEEHEASYKQENTPRYNAKALAKERARLNGATLLLGSATPSLESFHASYLPKEPPRTAIIEFLKRRESDASGNDRLLRIEMPERIDNRPLPAVQVVDMRDEFKRKRALFAAPLADAMADRLTKGQQTILFLNRRGYAQFVLCRDCGYAARCPNCAVSLAFHIYDRSLKCHHCDHTGRAPNLCPDCGSMKIRAFGLGTEKVEEEVKTLFPSARVARMDRDTTARKGAHTQIIREFRAGNYDILIGTQMVAKGLDFPNVTLVGVVSADTAINMPDFRAAERTFQLLTQVAGRAGRGKEPGDVFIQTFSPDHYAVQAAIQHDYQAFYEQELQFRRELRYPPFARFANLVCLDPDESRASAKANALAAALEEVVDPLIEIIGPSAAPLARLKNNYRFHVALRAPADTPFGETIRQALSRLMPSDRQSVHIDIDPLSMA